MEHTTSDLLEQTLEQVRPIAEQAGNCFYGRLFATAPHVLPLFRRNLSLPELAPAAAHRFIQLMTITIAAVVDEAAGDEGGDDSVRKLAERHVKYQIDPEHYPPMGDALLWALEVQLGDAFTPDARDAWSAAYDRLADRMIAVLEETAA